MVNEVFIEGDKKLRPAFSQLLRQKVKKQFAVSMEGSETDAAKKFLKPENPEGKALLIDLDASFEQKDEKLKKLKLEKDKGSVFFMVQKMEAWFLSQPEIIDAQFGIDVSKKVKRAVQEVEKPDELLESLVNTPKHPYHKVKDAAPMLSMLNLEQLMKDFPDVKNLVTELSKA
jgi:hypothetical protein